MVTNPAWIIQKKRQGKELSQIEIESFIEGVLTGTFAEYQTAALLMAIYFRGLTVAETVWLTQAMISHSQTYDLKDIPGVKIDKHSTGGVGDKVSLILAPLAAACGLKVPMMSGRGLGHTGGTLDKLESIFGFRVNLKYDEFKEALRVVGCALIGQSDSMVPADRKLYSLRDVTGTVESIPLITASILSKKKAEGAQFLVLDIKVGSGAFMKSMTQARKLANTLTKVAHKIGLSTRAIITNMNQPLGITVGNVLEVSESVAILKNEKTGHSCSSNDLRELTIQLASHMLEMCKVSRTLTEGRKVAQKFLNDGNAWDKFTLMIHQQGGDLNSIPPMKNIIERAAETNPKDKIRTLTAERKGYLSKIDTEKIGNLLMEIGGGRRNITDKINPRVGLLFHRKLGARVELGDPLVSIFFDENTDLVSLEAMFYDSIEITGTRKPVPQLVHAVIE